MTIKRCTLVFALLTSFTGFAQYRLSGTVSDEDGEPLIGATVFLLNTSKGAISDADGYFTINDVEAGTYFVEIFFLGYLTRQQTIAVNQDVEVSFIMSTTLAQLDMVVVTANKKYENIQEIPGSLSSINASQIADLQISNVNEIGRITPNFRTYDDGGGSFPLVSTRGITTIDPTPIVGVYIDDVPLFNVSSFPSYLADIERIEVLKGPQGTLYGRNSIGGVINIISKKPTNTTKGYVTAGYGNLNQYNVLGGMSAPLVENKLFARLSGGLISRDGYIENTFLKNKDLLGRKAYNGNVRFTYLANDNLSFKLSSGYERREVNAYAFVGGFGATFEAVEDAVNNTPYQVSQNLNGLYTTNISNNAFTVSFANDNIKIDAITAYQFTRLNRTNDDFDFSPADIRSVISDVQDISTISEEIRVSSNNKSKLSWIGGLYVYNVTNKSERGTNNGADNASSPMLPPADAAQYPYDQLASNKVRQIGYSVFAQASYELTDKLTATVGMRYELEDSKLDVNNRYEKDGQPFNYPALRAVPIAFTKKAQFNAFTPKFNVVYQVTKNSLIFANITRGYRPGGVNQFDLDINDISFNPEFSWNYELGTKNKLWNDRLKLNATAFLIQYTDQQLFNVIDIATFSIGTENIGNSRNYGVELETEIILAKGLNFIGNLGYLKTEFTDYTYSLIDQATFSTSNVDNKGKGQVMSPQWSGNTRLNYSIDVFAGWKGSIAVDYQYQSDVFFDPENTAKQAAYGLLNSRAVLGSKHLEFSLWGQNLTDVTYLSYGYSVSQTGIFASYGLPRTFGVSVTGKF